MRPGWTTVWLASAVCVVCLLLILAPAFGRDPDGRYSGSRNEQWFRSQHNEQGQWCCDKSDGHPFYGEWTPNHDGSVTLKLDGGTTRTLPAYMVLKGPNPTGHAVYWYLDTYGGRIDYCFAPGSLT